jgi:hypothetical protein
MHNFKNIVTKYPIILWNKLFLAIGAKLFCDSRLINH